MKKRVEKAGEPKQVVETRSAAAVKKLAECEEAIQKNSKMFFLAGEALTQINEEELYKPEFTSFDRYCEGRWGFSGSHARRLMDSWKLVEKLRSGIPELRDDELPQNEFQARLYMDLREEKHWVRSWKTLLKAAKEESIPISANLIREHCGEAKNGGGKKMPHPDAKTKVIDQDEPQVRHVKSALNLIEDARASIDEFGPKDWQQFLDEIEALLESV